MGAEAEEEREIVGARDSRGRRQKQEEEHGMEAVGGGSGARMQREQEIAGAGESGSERQREHETAGARDSGREG